LRKYQDADETQAASRVRSSIPLCNIGLNLNVSGNGTFAAKTKKEKHIYSNTVLNFRVYIYESLP
jgi:hypothetical protein